MLITVRRVATAIALVVVAGCSGPSHAQHATGSTSRPEARPAPALGDPPNRRVTKLLVVIEENHTLAQMREGMPYTFGLAKRYGYATRYYALTHPSLPNYLAIAGGSLFGVADDKPPSAHPVSGMSIFDRALARGRTAATYAQGMPAACWRSDSGAYAVRHNPWAYFTAGRTGCAAHDLPYSNFAQDAAAGDLPRVGLVIPDLLHDAHDGSLAAADDWFRALMAQVAAGPDWQSGHLAVVLTADEDDRSAGNRVLTVVIHPSQDHHVVTTVLDHYSLSRLYAEVSNVRPLRKARTATSMASAFGLRVP